MDGAARNFIRIRRELGHVMSGLQQFEKLSNARNKDNPNEEERELMAALKSSAEKALEISHKAASACFQKAKPPDSDEAFQCSRSFTASSSKPIHHLMNHSSSLGTNVITQITDNATHAVGSPSPKRPFSMMAFANSIEDLQSSNSDHSLTAINEDHLNKVECKKPSTAAHYTQWTPGDPPEHKPEDWQPKECNNVEPYRTELKTASEIRVRRSQLYNSHSVEKTDKAASQNENKKSQGEEKSNHAERNRSSVSPTFSDASDSDLQLERVMAKISSLEEERLHLMQTIEILQSDNVSVRQSLRETLGTLEMKDVQLKLAMQDLGIATSEIRKASELNGKLRTLERERNTYVERLALLEDESSAVKLSLIQLLQDKSAINKNLALENFQLQRQLTLTAADRHGPKGDQEPSSNHKEEQNDVGPTVHKQGFLVKRGGRVRTWKKRLFVLDSTGLAYYKTEQPIQNIPLNDIVSATVSREVVPFFSHLFEIQTSSRTYLCGASTHEEMQSWVGMLQTLTQYCRQHDIVGVCTTNKGSSEEVSDKENEDHAE